jgi:hypothetical protein
MQQRSETASGDVVTYPIGFIVLASHVEVVEEVLVQLEAKRLHNAISK